MAQYVIIVHFFQNIIFLYSKVITDVTSIKMTCHFVAPTEVQRLASTENQL